MDKPNQNFSMALSHLQTICSRQEKCVADLYKSLKKFELSESEEEKLIQLLIEDKFIDEQRYADAFVRDKSRFNKWGRTKIQYMLRQKRIPQNIINQSLSLIEESDYQQDLEKLIQNKWKSLGLINDYPTRSKIYRHALSKGYSMEEINMAIAKIKF